MKAVVLPGLPGSALDAENQRLRQDVLALRLALIKASDRKDDAHHDLSELLKQADASYRNAEPAEVLQYHMVVLRLTMQFLITRGFSAASLASLERLEAFLSDQLEGRKDAVFPVVPKSTNKPMRTSEAYARVAIVNAVRARETQLGPGRSHQAATETMRALIRRVGRGTMEKAFKHSGDKNRSAEEWAFTVITHWTSEIERRHRLPQYAVPMDEQCRKAAAEGSYDTLLNLAAHQVAEVARRPKRVEPAASQHSET